MLSVTSKSNSANVFFMSTLGQKIKAARLSSGMKQTDLAEKLGVTRNAVSLWESDKNGPVMATLMRLAKIIPLEIEGVTSSETAEPSPSGLPIMGEVRAGAWLEIDSDVEPTGHIPASSDQRYRGQRQYALKVVGTSMNLVAKPGIFVVVADWTDNGADLKHDDVVVVRRERAHTYEVTLKKARKVGDTWELWPESDDPKHQEPIRLKDENPEWSVVIVGKVIGKYEPL
jgi:transcriptional regulator with XRE-family HTH domain